jgi:hypothetical protein
MMLSMNVGLGQATLIFRLEDFPSAVGTHSGAIAVGAQGTSVGVRVALGATSEDLQRNDVLLLTRDRRRVPGRALSGELIPK